MSNLDKHTDFLSDRSSDDAPGPLEEASVNAGTQRDRPVPESPQRSSSSQAPTGTPSPLDDVGSPDSSLHGSLPGSSDSVPSTATLSGNPASLLVVSLGDITGDPLVAEPESSSERETHREGTIWLATVPVTMVTGLRYSRRDKLNYDKLSTIIVTTIPPFNGIQSRPETLGSLEWKRYEHPEGSVYFRAENFCTNLWLYDKANLEAIEQVVSKLRAAVTGSERPQLLSCADIEFGIDLMDDITSPGDKLGCYYAVNHRDEEVFWFHEVDSNYFCDSIDLKIVSRDHLRSGARMGYWDHIFMFPHGRNLSPYTVSRLRAIISYQMYDKETSRSSTSPYSSNDAHRILQTLKEIEHESPGQITHPEHVVMIARTHSTLYREKLLRFHGERFAQLDCDQSVFEEGPNHYQHSKTFSVLSWLFFLTPYLYLERLSHTWVDNKINYDHWSNFISELQGDWAASITPSTIILSANVGFLAIQSVDQNGMAEPDRTMAQIISYISTLLSLGNIVACTILSAQHRKSTHRYSENAAAYLCGRALSRRGMENLAIIFSIPAAFFLWGLVTFFIAIFWVCMHDTSSITRIAVSAIAAISVLLVAVVLWNSDWKSQPSINSIATKMQRMRGMVKRAPVTAATRWKKLSRTLSESTGLSRLTSVPRRMSTWRRRTTQLTGSDHGTIAEEGNIALEPQRPTPFSPHSDQMV